MICLGTLRVTIGKGTTRKKTMERVGGVGITQRLEHRTAFVTTPMQSVF